MREVKGYVFVAYFNYSKHLFGYGVNEVFKSFENLRTNNITPYVTKREVRSGAKDFKKRMGDAGRIRLASLEMQIAESPLDLEILKGKEPLIVIASFEFAKDFFGPINKRTDYMGALPGMRLTENGFKPFYHIGKRSAYERAEYLAREINRQGQSPATISTFSFRFIQ